jgi:uncharacterized protein YuzE
MTRTKPIRFELSISGRDDGTLEAAYIQLLDEKVSRTKEVVEDVVLADYTADGRLIGIEILAPARLGDLARLVKQEATRRSFRRFIKKSVPRDLLVA